MKAECEQDVVDADFRFSSHFGSNDGNEVQYFGNYGDGRNSTELLFWDLCTGHRNNQQGSCEVAT